MIPQCFSSEGLSPSFQSVRAISPPSVTAPWYGKQKAHPRSSVSLGAAPCHDLTVAREIYGLRGLRGGQRPTISCLSETASPLLPSAPSTSVPSPRPLMAHFATRRTPGLPGSQLLTPSPTSRYNISSPLPLLTDHLSLA